MIVGELLGDRGCEIGEGLVGPLGVEPIHPVQRFDLDMIDGALPALPWWWISSVLKTRPFVGQSVVERVGHGPDGGIDALLEQPVVKAMEV